MFEHYIYILEYMYTILEINSLIIYIYIYIYIYNIYIYIYTHTHTYMCAIVWWRECPPRNCYLAYIEDVFFIAILYPHPPKRGRVSKSPNTQQAFKNAQLLTMKNKILKKKSLRKKKNLRVEIMFVQWPIRPTQCLMYTSYVYLRLDIDISFIYRKSFACFSI